MVAGSSGSGHQWAVSPGNELSIEERWFPFAALATLVGSSKWGGFKYTEKLSARVGCQKIVEKNKVPHYQTNY